MFLFFDHPLCCEWIPKHQVDRHSDPQNCRCWPKVVHFLMAVHWSTSWSSGNWGSVYYFWLAWILLSWVLACFWKPACPNFGNGFRLKHFEPLPVEKLSSHSSKSEAGQETAMGAHTECSLGLFSDTLLRSSRCASSLLIENTLNYFYHWRTGCCCHTSSSAAAAPPGSETDRRWSSLSRSRCLWGFLCAVRNSPYPDSVCLGSFGMCFSELMFGRGCTSFPSGLVLEAVGGFGSSCLRKPHFCWRQLLPCHRSSLFGCVCLACVRCPCPRSSGPLAGMLNVQICSEIGIRSLYQKCCRLPKLEKVESLAVPGLEWFRTGCGFLLCWVEAVKIEGLLCPSPHRMVAHLYALHSREPTRSTDRYWRTCHHFCSDYPTSPVCRSCQSQCPSSPAYCWAWISDRMSFCCTKRCSCSYLSRIGPAYQHRECSGVSCCEYRLTQGRRPELHSRSSGSRFSSAAAASCWCSLSCDYGLMSDYLSCGCSSVGSHYSN